MLSETESLCIGVVSVDSIFASPSRLCFFFGPRISRSIVEMSHIRDVADEDMAWTESVLGQLT